MFANYPKIVYKNQELTDITLRYDIRNYIKSNIVFYEKYSLKDGEIPRILAHKLYGDETYEWILLLMNDITNPLFEWLMTDEELDEYIDKKYEDRYATHHYESEDGYIVDPDEYGLVKAVSNEEYEQRKNEERREIVVLKPEYVISVEEELDRRLSNA